MSAGSNSNRSNWRSATICGAGNNPGLFKKERLFWVVCCVADDAAGNSWCSIRANVAISSDMAVSGDGWITVSLDASPLVEQRSMKPSASNCCASFSQQQWSQQSWLAKKKLANETKLSRH